MSSEIFYKDYISKILLLESKVKKPQKGSYYIKPFKLSDPSNIIIIQNVARKLADFVDLHDLMFIVNYRELKQKVGGEIELSYCNEVFIDISKNLLKSPKSILATLSHEITHKIIQINNLVINSHYENEVFTDLTAIYVGFGKLMLNGRYTIDVNTNGNLQETTTTTVGYLTQRQLTFIYLTVSKIKNVTRRHYVSGLDKYLKSLIREFERKYKPFFRNIKAHAKIQHQIESERLKIAYLDKLHRISGGDLESKTSKFIFDQFRRLNLYEDEIMRKKESSFLLSISDAKSFENNKNQFPKMEIDSKNIRKLINAKDAYLKKAIGRRYLVSTSAIEKINHFNCPNCSTTLRINKSVKAFITCPKCKFKFAVDTNNKSKMMKIITSLYKIITLHTTQVAVAQPSKKHQFFRRNL